MGDTQGGRDRGGVSVSEPIRCWPGSLCAAWVRAGKTVSGDSSLIAGANLSMMEFCSGQDFGLNYTAAAHPPPPSPPDLVFNNKHINLHQPPAPFYQEPPSPENESFGSRSEILLRPASPFPHTPSPTNQPSSPSELPYSKSSSPNGPSSYVHSKPPSPLIGSSHGEPQHLLDPCESSEPFIKPSSPPEPSYVYSKSLEPVSQFHLEPCQPSLAYPHYLQEGAESCLHYQVQKFFYFYQPMFSRRICPQQNCGKGGHHHQLFQNVYLLVFSAPMLLAMC